MSQGSASLRRGNTVSTTSYASGRRRATRALRRAVTRALRPLREALADWRRPATLAGYPAFLEPMEPRVLLSSSLDLVITHEPGNGISIVKNNGDDTFAGPVLRGNAALGPIAAGDFDGDGDTDLVAGATDANQIWVFRNLGNGSYDATQQPFNTAGLPGALVVGDFNGDGLADVAVANQTTDNVSLFFGKATGTILAAQPSPVAVGDAPGGIAAGDIDGDGDTDLVTANTADGTLSLLLNNGSGAFTAGATLTAGQEPTEIHLADLDGADGLDILVLNQGAETLGVFLNDGNGDFADMDVVALGGGAADFAVGHLDDDGHLDLAVSRPDLGDVAILLGSGSGGFATPQSLATAAGPGAVAIADVTGDEAADLVVTVTRGEDPDAIETYTGLGDGTFTAPVAVEIAPGARDLVLVDADFVGPKAPGIVKGVLFHDLNDNGVFDPWEDPLPGRTVYIDSTGSGIPGTFDEGELFAITDANGEYSFSLQQGVYLFRQVLPEGWEQSLPSATDYYPVQVTVASSATRLFGSFDATVTPTTATIAGVAFDDANSNGVRDNGELPLEGVTIYLDANDNGIFDIGEISTTTAADGSYALADVPAGQHIVRQMLEDDRAQTSPVADISFDLELFPQTGQGAATAGAVSSFSWTDDGRFLVFTSTAALLPADTNGLADVYLYDADDQTLTLVSADAMGAAANAASLAADVSADGRYVVFTSDAGNLIDGASITGTQVYLKDMQTGSVQLLSASGPDQGANAASGGASISDDGRYIAFHSAATNLHPDVSTAIQQVYLYDTQSDSLTLVTRRLTAEGNGHSRDAVISSDGTHIVFTSAASNLMDGDEGGHDDIFRYTIALELLERVSVTPLGEEANGASGAASVTADGRFVAFASAAGNLVAGDTGGFVDIFVKDMLTGMIQRVSVSSAGVAGNANSGRSQISRDGRYVTFESAASNLVAGDVTGTDTFRRDLFAGQTVLVAPTAATDLAITTDGRVALLSSAANLVQTPDDNAAPDIFLATPVLDGGAHEITLVAAFDQLNRNFGSRSTDVTVTTGTISGQIVDEEAMPLLGWTVYIDANGNEALDPGELNVLTDNSGMYTFNGLNAGDYTIRTVLQPGFEYLDPAGGARDVTNFLQGEVEVGVDFTLFNTGIIDTLTAADGYTIVQDSDGDDTWVLLQGPGTLEVRNGPGGAVNLVLLNGTAASSIIILAIPTSGDGSADFNDILVEGSGLFRIIGVGTSLTGDIRIPDGSVTLIQLDDMTGGTIEIGGTATSATRMIFRDLTNVAIQMEGHLADLRATSFVNAPSLDLTAATIGVLAVTGDLDLDIIALNPMGARFGLVTAYATGTISGTWSINGDAYQIVALGDATNFSVDVFGHLSIVRLAAATSVNFDVDGLLGALVATSFTGNLTADMINGVRTGAFTGDIQTNRLNALVATDYTGDIHGGLITTLALKSFTGDITGEYLNLLDVTGDFQGDLTLAGTHAFLLRTAAVRGQLTGTWDIQGVAVNVYGIGAVDAFDLDVAGHLYNLVLGTVADADVTVAEGFIRTIRATGWENGQITADSAGTITVVGNFGADVLLRGTDAGYTLGVLNVFGVLGRPDDAENRSQISVDGHVQAIAANQFNRVAIDLGVTGSPLGGDLASHPHTLAAIAVRQQPGQAGTVDTLINAYAIGRALMGVVETDNGGDPIGIGTTAITQLVMYKDTTPIVRVHQSTPGVIVEEGDFTVEIFPAQA